MCAWAFQRSCCSCNSGANTSSMADCLRTRLFPVCTLARCPETCCCSGVISYTVCNITGALREYISPDAGMGAICRPLLARLAEPWLAPRHQGRASTSCVYVRSRLLSVCSNCVQMSRKSGLSCGCHVRRCWSAWFFPSIPKPTRMKILSLQRQHWAMTDAVPLQQCWC